MVDTPFPKEIWLHIAQIRAAVFEAVATLSPPDWSFVLTNALTHNAQSVSVYHSALELAERRSATFVPVQLLCDTQEHIRRIKQLEREAQMKDTNPETAKGSSPETLYLPAHPNTLTLDTSTLSAKEAAVQIIHYAEGLE